MDPANARSTRRAARPTARTGARFRPAGVPRLARVDRARGTIPRPSGPRSLPARSDARPRRSASARNSDRRGPGPAGRVLTGESPRPPTTTSRLAIETAWLPRGRTPARNRPHGRRRSPPRVLPALIQTKTPPPSAQGAGGAAGPHEPTTSAGGTLGGGGGS